MADTRPIAVELLYFRGCPHVGPTLERVRRVLSDLGLTTDVALVEVRSPSEAERRCFLGSPTVRVEGRDVEPGADDRKEFGLGCRRYDGSGVPPTEWIAAAIRRPGESG